MLWIEVRPGFSSALMSPATKSIRFWFWYSSDSSSASCLVGNVGPNSWVLKSPSVLVLRASAVCLSEPYILEPSTKAVSKLICSLGPGWQIASDLLNGRQSVLLGKNLSVEASMLKQTS